MSRDSEIRRMSLLKSGVSPFSVLNLSLEILKARAEEITVPAIFGVAANIYMELPGLKKAVDKLNLATAKEMEKWVVGNDVPAPAPAATPIEDMPEPVAMPVPAPAAPAPAEPAKAPAPDKAEDKPTPAPVVKTDNVIVGEVSAVSRNGKGVKIGDVWYNVTSKTVKTVEPEKGKTVKVTFTKGTSGLLADQIDAA